MTSAARRCSSRCSSGCCGSPPAGPAGPCSAPGCSRRARSSPIRCSPTCRTEFRRGSTHGRTAPARATSSCRRRSRSAPAGPSASASAKGSPDRIPAATTDLIFAAIGEELGLIGATAIIAAFLLLVAAGLRIAMRADRPFDQLLAAGLTLILGVQSFLIIGGVTRILPLTGITLPFVSYGGSSLIANWILVAILLRISATSTPGTRHRRPSRPTGGRHDRAHPHARHRPRRPVLPAAGHGHASSRSSTPRASRTTRSTPATWRATSVASAASSRPPTASCSPAPSRAATSSASSAPTPRARCSRPSPVTSRSATARPAPRRSSTTTSPARSWLPATAACATLFDDDGRAPATSRSPCAADVQKAAADALGNRQGRSRGARPDDRRGARAGVVPVLRPDPARRPPHRRRHCGLRGAARGPKPNPLHPPRLPRVVPAGLDVQGRHRRRRTRSGTRARRARTTRASSSSTCRAPTRTCRTSAAARAAARSPTSCAVSCNTGFAQVGLDLGGDKLGGRGGRRSASASARRSIWPQRGPVLLPGGRATSADATSASPALPSAPSASRTSSATPLQMALVAAAIANGGVIMKPHVIAQVTDARGTVLHSYSPSEWRTATSPETADGAQGDDGRRRRAAAPRRGRRSRAPPSAPRPAPRRPSATTPTPGSSPSPRPRRRRSRWRSSSRASPASATSPAAASRRRSPPRS